MPAKPTLQALEKRRDRLKERLHNEKLRLHEVGRNMGWGAGMRRTKCTPSFRKENELIEKLRVVESEIEAIKTGTTSDDRNDYTQRH